MATDYCEHCGSHLEAGAKFCSECGEPVDIVDDGWGTVTLEEQAAVAKPGQDTTLAVLAHLLPLVTWVLGPLAVYFVAEDEFTRESARNAINWQIMFTIYILISFALVFLLVGFVLLPLVGLLDTVFCIVAAVKAYEGQTWKYPLTPDIV